MRLIIKDTNVLTTFSFVFDIIGRIINPMNKLILSKKLGTIEHWRFQYIPKLVSYFWLVELLNTICSVCNLILMLMIYTLLYNKINVSVI